MCIRDRPNYHGHNYELEVKVVGEPDKKTGFVMDMKELSDPVSYTHLRAHETVLDLVCRLLLEKKKDKYR